MNETAGKVFSIAKENANVPGCTLSKNVYHKNGYHIQHFSLAAHTNISAEIYSSHKLIYVDEGSMTIFTKQSEDSLKTGDAYLLPIDIPVGMKTEKGVVYTEIQLLKETHMNEMIKSGKVFQLKDLLPVQKDRIINMDIIDDEHLKFVVMSFGAGTGLSEHAAPGEAMIFALEGEGIIGYEGEEHVIKAGENFKFDKNGRHYVKATTDFKMALLLTLE